MAEICTKCGKELPVTGGYCGYCKSIRPHQLLAAVMAMPLFIANLFFAVKVHGSFWGWVVGVLFSVAIPMILIDKLRQKPVPKNNSKALHAEDGSLEARIARLNSLLANGLISVAEHGTRKAELIREI